MARDHGRILCRIWSDKDFRALPRTAQALYMQLLSQKEINNAGVLPLMLSKWAKGCDEIASSEELTRDLAALIAARFVVVDSDSEEVLVRSFIRNDGVLKQPNVFKNALRCAEAVESEAIRRSLAEELRRTGRADALRVADILDPPRPDPDPIPNPSETLPEEFENPSETLEIEPEENRRSNPSGTLSNVVTLREPFAHPCGEGEGVGEGENSRCSVGHLGGVARAGTRAAHAHVREEPPTPHQPPSPYCPRHPGGTSESCGQCAHHRKQREAFDREQVEQAAAREQLERRRRAAQVEDELAKRRAAIASCELCDADGFIEPTVKCLHDRSAVETARRGSAKVAAALAEVAARKAAAPVPSPIPAPTPVRPSTGRTAPENHAPHADAHTQEHAHA
ncbi:hypothetical protein [Nocardia farcinica]|uniref:hypothetical protein n=1 Tax=Nocardia farcinica TaxID=37329 RepID=UPI0024552528|nr:hypothetical protein [Nocardia farcinica]